MSDHIRLKCALVLSQKEHTDTTHGYSNTEGELRIGSNIHS